MDAPDGAKTNDGRGATFLLVDDDDGKKGIGILFFRKWEEERENFTTEMIDYMTELDEGGFIDFGMVLRSDVTDPDELVLFRKVSNFSQAANNSLHDVSIHPPFYYMAVPLLNRDYGQYICDMIKEAYDIESLFFSYPTL